MGRTVATHYAVLVQPVQVAQNAKYQTLPQVHQLFAHAIKDSTVQAL
jgi:hypothetical protein